MKLKLLSHMDVVNSQQRGRFDEHLSTLYSCAYGEPYLYEDKFLVYHDSWRKTVWLTLFELEFDGEKGSNKERMICLRNLMSYFKPVEVVVTSPFEMPSVVEGYNCEKVYSDRDYQVSIERFDERLGGGSYKSLRYRVNHARRCGYLLDVGKTFTPAHMNIMARFLAKSKNYELWDYQLYLALGEYVSRFDSPRLFNVSSDGLLIGFDVVDCLSDVMVVPLGFYLDYPSIADFLIYEEIVYAKKAGFKWLDIGWACNVPGIEEFKVKWKAVPRFRVYMQVFRKA